MVRAPCCEKMGLKKGPWTSEEDQILVNYIQINGHSNWRALPKLAGLSRCGKSCRLRWINYLRPDLKRGNFSREEEDAIIKLHEKMGNRWSAIAAKFPGRTDNEIKNVWHTHLKKRVEKSSTSLQTNKEKTTVTRKSSLSSTEGEAAVYMTEKTATYDDDEYWHINNILPQADESFWSEVLSADSGDVSSIQLLDSPPRQYSPVSDILNTTTSPSSQLPAADFPCNFWDVLNNVNDDNSGDSTTAVDSPQISSSSVDMASNSSVGSDFLPELEMISNVMWPAYNNININIDQINQEYSSAAGAVDQDYSFCTTDDDMVFWYNVFTRPEELPDHI